MPKISLLILLVLVSGTAGAHSFGRMYNLPVPVWLYLYGAAAALAVSFLVIGYFVSVGSAGRAEQALSLDFERHASWLRAFRRVAQGVAVLLLALCIVAGFYGTTDDYRNINMTLFWIIFILGLTYLTAITTSIYEYASPWVAVSDLIDSIWKGFSRGRIEYPARAGHWPALLLYMLFIWLELMGDSGPRSLAWILLGYSCLTLFGVWLFGRKAWFRYGEFLAVFFRLIALMAPIRIQRDDKDQRLMLVLQWPFLGLMQGRVGSMALLLFILFMLSSTAFDGLRETQVWRRLFWIDVYHLGLKDYVSLNPLKAFPTMSRWFGYWQAFWLLMSPLVYLVVYLGFIALMKLIVRSQLGLMDLACRFACSLLPIALVYNITHYYTLIQIQGVKIVTLISDPFGMGWDLFGTADWLRLTIIPNAEQVWHVQVGLIVFGHIISVYIAHLEALRTFSSHRQAVISQLPMLVLMLIFTTVGLWILSEPIQPGA